MKELKIMNVNYVANDLVSLVPKRDICYIVTNTSLQMFKKNLNKKFNYVLKITNMYLGSIQTN